MSAWQRRRLGKDNFRFLRAAESLSKATNSVPGKCSKQVGLAERALMLARTLPHGDQRKLELAIILAPDPKLLLLDEPTAGMAAEQVPEMMELISQIRMAGNKTIDPGGA